MLFSKVPQILKDLDIFLIFQLLLNVANHQFLRMGTSGKLFSMSTNTVTGWSMSVRTSMSWQDLLIEPAIMANGTEL